MISLKSPQHQARVVGVLILTAYGVIISEVVQSKFVVFAADVISGLSVIGIAVLLIPFFKAFSQKFAFAYLFFKAWEGLLMLLGAVAYQFGSWQYLRGLIYEGPHLYAFIIGGYFFYYLLLGSKLVPKFISYWGLIAVSSLLLTTVLKLLPINYPPVLDGLLVLIITNEVLLAFWLIFKGFNLSFKKGQNSLK